MAARTRVLAPLRRIYIRNEAIILGVIGLVLFCCIWELAALMGWINPIVLSSPGRIGEAFQQQLKSGELLHDLRVTMIEFSLGFILAALVGIALGIIMGLEQNIEYTLDPFIWFLYAAPMIAFYPLLIVWLGFGFWTVIAITFILTVIPIAVNTLTGVRSVDPLLIRTVRSFGGNTIDVVMKVILPSSVPLVLAGLRIGVGRALIGVVLGEMFSANTGLGFRMTWYGAKLRTTDALVPLLVIVVFGVAATQIIWFLEHRLARWREV